eukprot:7873910-Pyramimonas_sp.AAC.1
MVVEDYPRVEQGVSSVRGTMDVPLEHVSGSLAGLRGVQGCQRSSSRAPTAIVHRGGATPRRGSGRPG